MCHVLDDDAREPPERLVRRHGHGGVKARVHEHPAGARMFHEEGDHRRLHPLVAGHAQPERPEGAEAALLTVEGGRR